MDRTGFITEDFESVEQATRVLNANGYTDNLIIKKAGIFSTNLDRKIEEKELTIYETHRSTSQNGLVRMLFAIAKEREPLGTLSIACGAQHADGITQIQDLKKYFKLENQ